MASAAFLIYSGCMPLIKMFFTIFFGYILARKDLFPPAASRGASQVTMNISLPALIFANIVPAFTPANVAAIGPLLLLAYTYQIIGFLFGYIIRELFYVPRNFWQGIVIMCGMSNWGNLPNSIVTSVTAKPPFNPDTDTELGVSFVSIFIVTYHITFWVFGGARSLSWDYLPGVPQKEEAERRVPWKEKPIGGWIARTFLGHRRPSPASVQEKEKESTPPPDIAELENDTPLEMQETPVFERHPNADPDIQLVRQTSRLSTTSFRSRRPSAGQPPPPSFRSQPQPQPACAPALPPPSIASSHTAAPTTRTLLLPLLIRILKPVSVIITPVTATLAVSLPIALINSLKALFVPVPGGPSWTAPDGRPPLAFVIDTATFLGTMAIPLALILLGASFARLRIPRPLSRLPLPAMLAVSAAKMFLLPVIGVLVVQAMVRGGLIARDARAEKFVGMLLSGTPAAVNQLIVASLYAPDGDVDTLSVRPLLSCPSKHLTSNSTAQAFLLVQCTLI
ncbi:auxin efflux carrier [Neolentinus lepideus HHB14362 ss-1]|uniref:Auxin efflux carrier n=1 Tax=Neolentinus lepideus HHB14362 ss-1 TaxID=1314782 RepID=A0A165T288_9AGAM|nr:auxin efflux carrier [Neolentinus lepideus HHB14362 ss-1]